MRRGLPSSRTLRFTAEDPGLPLPLNGAGMMDSRREEGGVDREWVRRAHWVALESDGALPACELVVSRLPKNAQAALER